VALATANAIIMTMGSIVWQCALHRLQRTRHISTGKKACMLARHPQRPVDHPKRSHGPRAIVAAALPQVSREARVLDNSNGDAVNGTGEKDTSFQNPESKNSEVFEQQEQSFSDAGGMLCYLLNAIGVSDRACLWQAEK